MLMYSTVPLRCMFSSDLVHFTVSISSTVVDWNTGPDIWLHNTDVRVKDYWHSKSHGLVSTPHDYCKSWFLCIVICKTCFIIDTKPCVTVCMPLDKFWVKLNDK
jgi:hypothetical protein